MKQFEFKADGYYRLVSVKDRQGNDRSNERPLYKDRVGCIATDFFYDNHPAAAGLYRLNMTFVRNKDGHWANRTLRNSVVHEINKTPRGFQVVTAYSVYLYEEAELNEPPLNEDKNVIELYLSCGDKHNFAKGFYHDENGNRYELEKYVHVGMFEDSVLLNIIEDEKPLGCACRYFPGSYGVTFYDTLYKQQDYSTPMSIYNTGTDDLEIRFEGFPHVWTIAPGECKRIVPFDSAGADPEE